MVDYIGQIERRENDSRKASKISSSMKVGQIYGIFNLEDLISQQLYLKYHEDNNDFYQDLLSIDKISIEALTFFIFFSFL